MFITQRYINKCVMQWITYNAYDVCHYNFSEAESAKEIIVKNPYWIIFYKHVDNSGTIEK